MLNLRDKVQTYLMPMQAFFRLKILQNILQLSDYEGVISMVKNANSSLMYNLLIFSVLYDGGGGVFEG